MNQREKLRQQLYEGQSCCNLENKIEVLTHWY